MVRFLVILFVLFLFFRFAAKLIGRLFRIKGIFSFSGPGAERPVRSSDRNAVEADYEVIESHIRKESRED